MTITGDNYIVADINLPAIRARRFRSNFKAQCDTALSIISPFSIMFTIDTVQWRHNECDGVSNHRPLDCLLNRLFRSTGLCEGIHRWPANSPHNRPVTRKMFPFHDVFMTPWIARDRSIKGALCARTCHLMTFVMNLHICLQLLCIDGKTSPERKRG